MTLLWIAIACIIFSAFCTLASYCLRDFRRGALEETFGANGQRRLKRLEDNLMALRLTAAFCRSAANLTLVVAILFLYNAPQAGLGRLLAAMATAWALIAIFGEAIPHAWAYASGEKVLSVILEPLLALRYLLYPVVAVMQAFDTPIRRLSGAEQNAEMDVEEAKQEIMDAASEGRAEGAVNAEEVNMIRSVIEFGDIQAGEIMTPRTDIFALPAATPWVQACEMIFRAGHTRVPVFEGDIDNIVGILYAKDLLQYAGQGDNIDLRQVMRKPFFVPETKKLDDLLREFKARKVHMAVVLDEYGGTAGLVTFEDVLEEIVGDISDEYDRPEPALMKRIDDRTAEIDGRMYIDDLNEAMGLEIPEDQDYDTIAGFMFSELGYIPTNGETLDVSGARFTVLAADERKITRVKVERCGLETDGESSHSADQQGRE